MLFRAIGTLGLLALSPDPGHAADGLRHGTSLAALRNKDEIAIAVDSRVVDGLGLREPDACKLRVYSDTAVAIHGIAEDSAAAFDLFALTAHALAGTDDLSTVARRVASDAAQPLGEAIARVMQDDPLLLRTPALQANPAGVVLARNERGTPKFAYVKFAMKPGAADAVHISSEILLCPGQCPTGVGTVLVSPDASAVSSFDMFHPDYWKHPLAPQAQAFVASQANGIFPDVGPPIDVVRITRNGIAWTARKDSCHEKE